RHHHCRLHQDPSAVAKKDSTRRFPSTTRNRPRVINLSHADTVPSARPDMYLPKSFAEDRLPVLHDAIRAAGLATLVTVTAEGPVASHIPMLLDAGSGERGTLLGHVARANPQWRDTIAGTPALAIFLGPDAYVSPTWYPSKQETGKVVPTWNYIAIHAYGPPTFFDDPD